MLPYRLKKLHDWEPQHICLYRGELAPDLAEAAPYLVRLERGTPLSRWILEQGWGQHWGIFALVDEDVVLKDLRKHFRTFLMIENPDGKPLYFRYYDPRILRAYLPTCNDNELATVFGPVQAYAMESVDGAAVEEFYSPREPGVAQRHLRMRPEQMDALALIPQQYYIQEMVAHALEFFPDACKRIGGTKLEPFIRDGIAQASEYGIEGRVDVKRFLNLRFAFGPDFDRQCQWAREILDNASITSPSTKSLLLHEAGLSQLEASEETQQQKVG